MRPEIGRELELFALAHRRDLRSATRGVFQGKIAPTELPGLKLGRFESLGHGRCVYTPEDEVGEPIEWFLVLPTSDGIEVDDEQTCPIDHGVREPFAACGGSIANDDVDPPKSLGVRIARRHRLIYDVLSAVGTKEGNVTALFRALTV